MSGKGVKNKVVKKDSPKVKSTPEKKAAGGHVAVIIAVISFMLIILIAIGAGAWFFLNKAGGLDLDYSHINLENENMTQDEIKNYLLETNGNITSYEVDANLGIKMGFATNLFENLAPNMGGDANAGILPAIEMVYDYEGDYKKQNKELDFDGKIKIMNGTNLVNETNYGLLIKDNKTIFDILNEKNETEFDQEFFENQDVLGNTLKAIYNSEIVVEGSEKISGKDYYKIMIKPSPGAFLASFPNNEPNKPATANEDSLNTMTQEQIDGLLQNYSYYIWVDKKTLLIKKSDVKYEANLLFFLMGVDNVFELSHYEIGGVQYLADDLKIIVTPLPNQQPTLPNIPSNNQTPIYIPPYVPPGGGDNGGDNGGDDSCEDDSGCDSSGWTCNNNDDGYFECQEESDGCLHKINVNDCDNFEECVPHGSDEPTCNNIPLDCLVITADNVTQNLTENAYCIEILGNNISLNCKGYSVTNDKRGNGIEIVSNDSKLINCNITNVRTGIRIKDSNNIIIDNVDVKNNDYGIATKNSDNVEIINSIVYKSNNGIYFNATNSKVTNSKVTNNSNTGFILENGSGIVDVTSSIICNNTVDLNCGVFPGLFGGNTCSGLCGTSSCDDVCNIEPTLACVNQSGCENGAGDYCLNDSTSYTCEGNDIDSCFNKTSETLCTSEESCNQNNGVCQTPDCNDVGCLTEGNFCDTSGAVNVPYNCTINATGCYQRFDNPLIDACVPTCENDVDCDSSGWTCNEDNDGYFECQEESDGCLHKINVNNCDLISECVVTEAIASCEATCSHDIGCEAGSQGRFCDAENNLLPFSCSESDFVDDCLERTNQPLCEGSQICMDGFCSDPLLSLSPLTRFFNWIKNIFK